MTDPFAVIETGPLSGVDPTTTYYATKGDAVDQAILRAPLFETVEVVKVVRRWHTVYAPVTTEEIEEAPPQAVVAAPVDVPPPVDFIPAEAPPPARRRARRR